MWPLRSREKQRSEGERIGLAAVLIALTGCARSEVAHPDVYAAADRAYQRGRAAVSLAAKTPRVYVGDPLYLSPSKSWSRTRQAYGRVLAFELGEAAASACVELLGTDSERTFGSALALVAGDDDRSTLYVGAPGTHGRFIAGRVLSFEMHGSTALPSMELSWPSMAGPTSVAADEFGSELVCLTAPAFAANRLVVSAPSAAVRGGVALFELPTGRVIATRTERGRSHGYGDRLLRIHDRDGDGIDDVAVSHGTGHGFDVLAGADLSILETRCVSAVSYSEWMLRSELVTKAGVRWQIHGVGRSSERRLDIQQGDLSDAPAFRTHFPERKETTNFGASVHFYLETVGVGDEAVDAAAYSFTNPGYVDLSKYPEFRASLYGIAMGARVPQGDARVPAVHRVLAATGRYVPVALPKYTETGLGSNSILLDDIDGLGRPDLLLTNPKGLPWCAVVYSLDTDSALYELVP
jgi:hypothetical protein